MSTADAPPPQEHQQLNAPVPAQLIYADRIINFGIGACVSRLTLAMEVGENTFAPVTQLVIPTPALFEALEFMAGAIANDETMKKNIVEAMDAFKQKLGKSAD